MKPLAVNDLMFLWLERRNQPMHVGGLLLLSLPEGAGPEFMARLGQRCRAFTRAQPPFNQRLRRRAGLWCWDEDEDFDLEQHFKHLALPGEGSIRELLSLVSKLHGSLLDRERPLWEFYLIEGVEGRRAAIYCKIHHSLVDGVAAMRTLQRAMSEDSQVETIPFWAQSPKQRQNYNLFHPKSVLSGVTDELKAQVKTFPTVYNELRSALRDRRSNPDHVSVFQAPRSVLNRHVSGSRRFAAQDWSLDRIKTVAKKHGCTLNDVVLAMCSASLRDYLSAMNALPDKPLIAMVPMSMRKDDSTTGNQVTMILANLATDETNPVTRLHRIQRSVQTSKERYRRMNPREIINYLTAVMAPSGLRLLTGLLPKKQSFNVIISNVPGPQKPLYFDGAKFEGMYPVSIVLDGFALNITLTSYVDKLEFGVIACSRTLPSIQHLLAGLERGLSELEAARAEAA